MKKLFLIIFILILPLSFVTMQNTYNFYEIFKNLNSRTFCYIYNEQDVLDFKKNINLQNGAYTSLKNGNKQFIYFSSSEPNTLAKPQYMQVEAILTEKDIDNILEKLNAKIVKIDFYENTKILYCYTSNFPKYTILNNRKVNLQFAVNKQVTIIGYPMIYGSF